MANCRVGRDAIQSGHAINGTAAEPPTATLANPCPRILLHTWRLAPQRHQPVPHSRVRLSFPRTADRSRDSRGRRRHGGQYSSLPVRTIRRRRRRGVCPRGSAPSMQGSSLREGWHASAPALRTGNRIVGFVRRRSLRAFRISGRPETTVGGVRARVPLVGRDRSAGQYPVRDDRDPGWSADLARLAGQPGDAVRESQSPRTPCPQVDVGLDSNVYRSGYEGRRDSTDGGGDGRRHPRAPGWSQP